MIFKASYLGNFDIAYKRMNVVKEGIIRCSSCYFTIDLGTEFKENWQINSTQHAELGIVGDIRGLVLSTVDNLVRMLTDCGKEILKQQKTLNSHH